MFELGLQECHEAFRDLPQFHQAMYKYSQGLSDGSRRAAQGGGGQGAVK